jgi:hypothetical protein
MSRALSPDVLMFPKDGLNRTTRTHRPSALGRGGLTDSDGDGIRDKEITGRLMPFEFTMLTYQTETAVQTAALMVSCLDQLGIVCTSSQPNSPYWPTANRNTSLAAMGGWGGQRSDTSRHMYATDGRNYGYYSNPRVDELLSAGGRLITRAARDLRRDTSCYGRINRTPGCLTVMPYAFTKVLWI